MRRKVIEFAGAASILALVAGNAGAQDAVCPKPVEVAGFRTCADVAKAEQEGTLVIYSTDVEQGQARIVAAFSASFPKIKPAYVRALSASLYARLQSERQAGQYLADLVNIDAVLANDFLKRKGYARYISPEMAGYRTEFRSKPEGYFTWAQLALAGIAYNPRLLTADQAPKAWKDILDLKYAGTINVKSSNSGVQHFVWFAVREVMGPDFWKGLAGQKPKAFDSYVQQYDRLVNGEDKIAVGAQYSGYLEFKAKGAPLEFVFPHEGTPASPQVWGIIDKSPNPQAARLFLDWLLSPVGQKVMQEALFLNSPRDDAASPPGGSAAAKLNLLSPSDWDGFFGSKRAFNAEWDRITGLR
jgi:iron(III) transport system substrate-binding protein